MQQNYSQVSPSGTPSQTVPVSPKSQGAVKQPQPYFTPWRLGLIAVFSISILFYLPSLMGLKVWDDVILLSPHGNASDTFYGALVHPFLGSYFRPLTSLSLVLDHSYAGDVPFLFHQTNLLLHAVTAVLVAYLALHLAGNRVAAIAAGLFFALQPIQVASVAWLGGRTDVLATFFLVAFLLALVQYHRSGKVGWFIAAVLTLLAAALTKEQCILLAFAVPISTFAIGDRQWKSAWRLSVPFLVLIGVYAGLFVLAHPGLKGGGSASPWSIWGGLDHFLKTLGHYSLMVVAPNNPGMFTFSLERYQSPAWTGLGLLFIVGWTWITVGLWKQQRGLAWLVLVAFLGFFPIANFITIPSFWLGPYRVSICGPAMACLFGAGFAWAWSNRNVLGGTLLVANLLLGTWVSWWAMHQWSTPLSLFHTMSKIEPHFMEGQGPFCDALNSANEPAQSLKQSDLILSWVFGESDGTETSSTDWRTRYAQGSSHLSPKMLRHLETDNPLPSAYVISTISVSRGLAHHLLGQDNLTRVDFERAVQYGPDNAQALMAYGNSLQGVDDSQSRKYIERAIACSPDDPGYKVSLAQLDLRKGHIFSAERLLTIAVREGSFSVLPYVLMADIQMGKGDLTQARHFLSVADTKLTIDKTEVSRRWNKLKALEQKKGLKSLTS